MGASTTISDSALTRLPTLNRNFSDFVQLVPQVATTTGYLSGGGVNLRQNSIQIDGAQSGDLFGLGTTGQPGASANAKSIPLDAVKEYQVLLSPFDVRQGELRRTPDQRRHEERHERVPRQRVRLHAQPEPDAHPAVPRELQAAAVRRHARRADHQGQLFFFGSGEIQQRATAGDRTVHRLGRRVRRAGARSTSSTRSSRASTASPSGGTGEQVQRENPNTQHLRPHRRQPAAEHAARAAPQLRVRRQHAFSRSAATSATARTSR